MSLAIRHALLRRPRVSVSTRSAAALLQSVPAQQRHFRDDAGAADSTRRSDDRFVDTASGDNAKRRRDKNSGWREQGQNDGFTRKHPFSKTPRTLFDDGDKRTGYDPYDKKHGKLLRKELKEQGRPYDAANEANDPLVYKNTDHDGPTSYARFNIREDELRKKPTRRLWRTSHVKQNPYVDTVDRPAPLPEELEIPDIRLIELEQPSAYAKRGINAYDEDGEFVLNRSFSSNRDQIPMAPTSTTMQGSHWLQQFHQELVRRDPRPMDLLRILLRIMAYPPAAVAQSYLPVHAHHVRQALQIIVQHREQRSLRPRMITLNAMDRLSQRIRAYREYEFQLALGQNRVVAERHGVRMTEDELAKRTAEAPSVQAWDRLRAMPLINDLLAESWTRSYRRPQLFDIHEALKTFVPSGQRKRTYVYNILLHLIMRSIPSARRDVSAVIEGMDELPMSSLRMRWDKLRSRRDDPLMDIRIRIPDSYDERLPMSGFELFEMVWKAMLQEDRPDAISFSIALSMETRMASYRAAKLRRSIMTGASLAGNATTAKPKLSKRAAARAAEEDELYSDADTAFKELYSDNNIAPWDPVIDALDTLRRRHNQHDIFSVEHINIALWAAMRQDPNRGRDDSLSPQDRHWRPHIPWPSSRSVMDVYGAMRGNLLKREMASLRGEDTSLASQQTKPSPAEVETAESIRTLIGPRHGVEGSGTQESLPADFVPTLATYELLISGLAFIGDLQGALQVLKDMTQTPVSSSQNKPFSTANAHEEASFAPSPRTYNSFFRGFCKHGVPSQMVSFNADDPSRSEWKPVEDEEALAASYALGDEVLTHLPDDMDARMPRSMQDWNIATLSTLVEAYLATETTALLPIHRAVLCEKDIDHQDREARLKAKHTRGTRSEEHVATFGRMAEDSDDDLSSIGLFDEEYRPLLLNGRAWRDVEKVRIAERNELHRRHLLAREFADDQRQELLRPVLDPQNATLTARSLLLTNAERKGAPPEEELLPHSDTTSAFAKTPAPLSAPKPFANAPSKLELFHFLTALRRVSNDDARWTLAQFVRAAAKFGPDNATSDGKMHDVWGDTINAEGWTGWKVENRVARTLRMLYERRDSLTEDDGKAWRQLYRHDVALEVSRRRAVLSLQRNQT